MLNVNPVSYDDYINNIKFIILTAKKGRYRFKETYRMLKDDEVLSELVDAYLMAQRKWEQSDKQGKLEAYLSFGVVWKYLKLLDNRIHATELTVMSKEYSESNQHEVEDYRIYNSRMKDTGHNEEIIEFANKIIQETKMSEIERHVVTEHYLNNQPLSKIAINLNFSEPYIYTVRSSAIDKMRRKGWDLRKV